MENYKRKSNCTCFICKKEVYKRPSEINKRKVFCSRACYGEFQTILVSCVVCGSTFKSGLNRRLKIKEVI